MYIECHYNAASGNILAVWEAGHQPFDNPADGWKPFATPVDPATGAPTVAGDGTLDGAQLPAGYAVAKLDLDYPTQLLIEQGAYDARIPKGQWIKGALRPGTRARHLQDNRHRAVKRSCRQFRYLYFIDRRARAGLRFPVLPYPKPPGYDREEARRRQKSTERT